MTATVLLAGCGGLSEYRLLETDLGDMVVDALDELPLIYRPTIYQGNIVSQESLDQIKPGMTKRQVQFVLGTPMLVDVFHGDRWDYIQTVGVGSKPEELQRITLYFSNDQLVRVEGDMRPETVEPSELEKKEIVVSVPDWEGDTRPWWKRLLNIDPID